LARPRRGTPARAPFQQIERLSLQIHDDRARRPALWPSLASLPARSAWPHRPSRLVLPRDHVRSLSSSTPRLMHVGDFVVPGMAGIGKLYRRSSGPRCVGCSSVAVR
jgi:hypothetical protein